MAIFRISPSLAFMILVSLILVLTLYLIVIRHPQIQELKRKMDLPEFQGTAHRQTIVFSFKRLHQRSVRLRAVLLVLGLVSLGLVPSFLR